MIGRLYPSIRVHRVVDRTRCRQGAVACRCRASRMLRVVCWRGRGGEEPGMEHLSDRYSHGGVVHRPSQWRPHTDGVRKRHYCQSNGDPASDLPGSCRVSARRDTAGQIALTGRAFTVAVQARRGESLQWWELAWTRVTLRESRSSRGRDHNVIEKTLILESRFVFLGYHRYIDISILRVQSVRFSSYCVGEMWHTGKNTRHSVSLK